MLTICWGAKGGSGTTVTAAALALSSATPSVLIDCDGTLPWALGIDDLDGPGIAEWLNCDAPVDRLGALETRLSGDHSLIHRGDGLIVPGRRWSLAAHDWIGGERSVVIDAGTNPDPGLLELDGANRILVVRPCYLALRAAAASPLPIDGVILIDEPGRRLCAEDVELALNAPVRAVLITDPAVARAVDAGLLVARLPRGMQRQLRDVA